MTSKQKKTSLKHGRSIGINSKITISVKMPKREISPNQGKETESKATPPQQIIRVPLSPPTHTPMLGLNQDL
jgi:hypothetical protein